MAKNLKNKISGKTDLIVRQVATIIYTLKESPCGTKLNNTQLFQLATTIMNNLDKVAKEALDTIIKTQNRYRNSPTNLR